MPQHAQRILILDLDVHQGDGTAEILSTQRGGVAPQPSLFSAASDVAALGDSRSIGGTNHRGVAAGQAHDSGRAYMGCREEGMKGVNMMGSAAVASLGCAEGIYTCSVHAERNFPARKQRSSLDVGLRDGVGDQEYLRCAICLPGGTDDFTAIKACSTRMHVWPKHAILHIFSSLPPLLVQCLVWHALAGLEQHVVNVTDGV